MKKLLIVIHSLSGGGAERVVTRLLSYLDTHCPGVELHLALLKPQIDYELPAGVNLHVLGKARKGFVTKAMEQSRVFKNLKRLMSGLRPDVTLSFMPTANYYCLKAKKQLGGAPKVVVSERVAFESNYRGLKRATLKRIIRKNYPMAAKVICVAQGVKNELVALGLPDYLCKVIPNSVDENELLKKAEARAPHKWAEETATHPLIVTAGRLTEQKGHDVLIAALGLLAKKDIKPRAMIFGTGPLKAQLESQIAELGLGEQVKLMGFNPNPYPELKRASLFVFPSRFEGFPNALLEAMALGVPSIATDCPYGPRELIGDGEYGCLVPMNDPAHLAESIEEGLAAVSTPAGRETFGKMSRAGASRYSIDHMVNNYLHALFD
ncbi:glycosyltransferase [Paraburkholderia sp. UCT31]|uniref:glycosyltransferase n=1 Tax=Paraburkholderia sp. UCT31 TaxID=2615209 RepID=UPI001654EDE6|nr:glycosyltransferase [Paraburkholderia sp. UCT31]MBC8737353.1 glycosyltransferase [Paraburkholderia sp. UCT31]